MDFFFSHFQFQPRGHYTILLAAWPHWEQSALQLVSQSDLDKRLHCQVPTFRCSPEWVGIGVWSGCPVTVFTKAYFPAAGDSCCAHLLFPTPPPQGGGPREAAPRSPPSPTPPQGGGPIPPPHPTPHQGGGPRAAAPPSLPTTPGVAAPGRQPHPPSNKNSNNQHHPGTHRKTQTTRHNSRYDYR